MAGVRHEFSLVDKKPKLLDLSRKYNSTRCYAAVSFPELYQTYHGYNSAFISMYMEPERNTWGPGPEYCTCVNLGSFNIDFNPKVNWYDIDDGELRRRGFVTASPRKDKGPNHFAIDKIWYESPSLDGRNRKSHFRLPVREAMKKLTNISWTEYRPRYESIISGFRQKTLEGLIEARTGLEDRQRKTLEKLDARIALGTTVPEDWERKLPEYEESN